MGAPEGIKRGGGERLAEGAKVRRRTLSAKEHEVQRQGQQQQPSIKPSVGPSEPRASCIFTDGGPIKPAQQKGGTC